MRQRGFTLLELLVALTVLGLAAAVAAGGLDGLGRALARERRAAEEGRWAIRAREWLREELTRALPLDWGPPQRPAMAFVGEPQRLRFVVAAPPYRAEAGLELVELALEERGGTRLLVARRAPLRRDGSGFAALAEVPPVTLAALAADHRFGYFGERPGVREPRWWPDWPAGSRLPRAVRLAGADEVGVLVVRLSIDTPLACLGAGAAAGAACR